MLCYVMLCYVTFPWIILSERRIGSTVANNVGVLGTIDFRYLRIRLSRSKFVTWDGHHNGLMVLVISAVCVRGRQSGNLRVGQGETSL